MVAAKTPENSLRASHPVSGAALASLALAPLVPAALAAIPGSEFRAVPIGSAVFALIAVVVVDRFRAWHPRRRFGPANVLTLFRAAGVSVLAGLTVTPQAVLGGAGWFAAGGAGLLLALDAIDGWLARRTGLASEFGARFDMEVDTLLLLVLSALAFGTGRAGAWVFAIGLLRHGFVLLGHARPRFRRALPPSRRRRIVCGLVVAVLAAMLAPPVQPPGSAWMAAGALAMLIWSFALDLAWLARQPG